MYTRYRSEYYLEARLTVHRQIRQSGFPFNAECGTKTSREFIIRRRRSCLASLLNFLRAYTMRIKQTRRKKCGREGRVEIESHFLVTYFFHPTRQSSCVFPARVSPSFTFPRSSRNASPRNNVEENNVRNLLQETRSVLRHGALSKQL